MSRIASMMLRKYLQSRDGNVAMLFAMLIAPLVMFAGLAIDLGRAERERDNAQSALDAAVLAGGTRRRQREGEYRSGGLRLQRR